MKINSSAAIMVAMLLAMAGCKKDTVEPPAPADNAINATVRMNWMFNNGMDAFALNSTVLHDSLGHAVKLDTVRFFVSGIHAMDDGGTAVGHYEDVYLLVDASLDSNNYLVGAISAPHIHEFHFGLGLDATANAGNPSTATPPLDDHSMFFSGMMAGMGYKFLELTGDADVDGDGVYETAVRYACGMNSALTEAHAHVHHNVVDGETFTAQINVDLANIFAGLDVASAPMPDMHGAECARMMLNLSAAIDGM